MAEWPNFGGGAAEDQLRLIDQLACVVVVGLDNRGACNENLVQKTVHST